MQVRDTDFYDFRPDSGPDFGPKISGQPRNDFGTLILGSSLLKISPST